MKMSLIRLYRIEVIDIVTGNKTGLPFQFNTAAEAEAKAAKMELEKKDDNMFYSFAVENYFVPVPGK